MQMKKLPQTGRRKVLLGTSAASVLAYTLAFAGPYRPVEPLPGGIIDMHCHVAGIGAGQSGCFVSDTLRNNWRFRVYLRSFGVSRSELLEKGDDLLADRISESLAKSRLVDKVVLLAMDGVVNDQGRLDTSRTEVYVPNEFVAKAARLHTNLLFGASVNPYRSDALERLDWAKAHGAVLVKWIPAIMDIDPADPRLIPFYRKLVELDLPLLTHTGKERSFSSSRDELSDPERLKLPLRLGVKVIAAHVAAGGTYEGERSTDRLARMMTEYPTLYSDISALTQVNRPGYLKEALLRPEFSGRLLYGSDFPLIRTPLVSPWYHCLRLSPWKIARISMTRNPWDADVETKQALGTPAEVFAEARWLLKTKDGTDH